ncbi:DNA-binding protein [Brachyspira sp. SAP_772]|uniref:DNA-binding protein n=1 Tax=Brachyspira sp. SAP_772 TaxID=2608385 RepID=UPI0012F501CF|nr:DNA-binding protein [Brachyspira sp. SAP_772]
MIKNIILILMLILLISCNRNNNTSTVNEIEPNDNEEYAQFIESDISLKGSLIIDDIDYYHIKPTNGFIMNFGLYANNDSNIVLEFYNKENKDILFKIETQKAKDYFGNIELKNIVLKQNEYLLKLTSEDEIDYNLKLNFSDDYKYKNEYNNNNIFYAEEIGYPNQKINGFFIKKDLVLDEVLKPYLKNYNIIDIDFYRIKNETDIDSYINIILEYKEDIEIILFDENHNYIRKAVNRIDNINFSKNREYYIALIYYGEKYLIEQYILYYEFSNK